MRVKTVGYEPWRMNGRRGQQGLEAGQCGKHNSTTRQEEKVKEKSNKEGLP